MNNIYLARYAMKLFTKDYKTFQIHDESGSSIKEIVGVEFIKPSLLGDEVDENGQLMRRREHPQIVGILHTQSKVKYGYTARGYPIYLFEPINKAYPPMICGSSEAVGSTNLLALAKFDSWDMDSKFPRGALTRIIGNCGDLASEEEAILLRYSPWAAFKISRVSSLYSVELEKRPLVKGFTFNIDPPGCQDVDDVFTIRQLSEKEWILTISITDVASAIEEGCILDWHLQKIGQTLYPEGRPPKHMLAPNLGTDELSLLVSKTRNAISLSVGWSSKCGLTGPTWSLSTVRVDKSYTYDEAQVDARVEMKALKGIAECIACKKLPDSTEWVEALMIYYNAQAGKLLHDNKTGILRHHDAPDQDKLARWSKIDERLSTMALSAATYVPGNQDIHHWGLKSKFYAHTSSPIRRYADLYNQRSLLAILKGEPVPPVNPALCVQLNALQKDAKAFERDSFFLHTLSENHSRAVEAQVIEIQVDKGAVQVWVPLWNKIIRVRCDLVDGPLVLLKPREEKSEPFPVELGQKVLISYHIDYNGVRWKDKIIFRLRTTSVDTSCPE